MWKCPSLRLNFERFIGYSRRVFRRDGKKILESSGRRLSATQIWWLYPLSADWSLFLPSLLPPVVPTPPSFTAVRSQTTKTEAILDATRASQIALALSGASFVPRHFSEFPTFSISVETLVNTRERKVRETGAGPVGRGLPKCEIMYKAAMNNDAPVIHCGRDTSPRLPQTSV